MKVIIDGIKYVPKVNIKPISNKSIQECLEILTSMRYFDQSHKMDSMAFDAINSLSPDLAKLDKEDAFNFIHGN
jgi:hypothetical protein